jgi:hypothetical protein
MRSPHTSALPSQSVDEYALMEACYETASRTMFDSEPEPSKIKEVADKFFQIAKDYLWGRCPRPATTTSSFGRYTTSLRSTPSRPEGRHGMVPLHAGSPD